MDVTTDGGSWTVTADLRDVARWEQYAHKQGLPLQVKQDDPGSPGVLWLMHLGWTASRRAGRTDVAFPQWLDTCQQVEVSEQPDVDPTQQAPGST